MIANDFHNLDVLLSKAICLIDIGDLKYSEKLCFCNNNWRIYAVGDFQWPLMRILLLSILNQPINLFIEASIV